MAFSLCGPRLKPGIETRELYVQVSYIYTWMNKSNVLFSNWGQWVSFSKTCQWAACSCPFVSLSRTASNTVISWLMLKWIWTSCLWRSLYLGSHSYHLRHGEREILHGGDRNKAMYCCISLNLTGQSVAGKETKHGNDTKYKFVLITFLLVEQ